MNQSKQVGEKQPAVSVMEASPASRQLTCQRVLGFGLSRSQTAGLSFSLKKKIASLLFEAACLHLRNSIRLT